ncbi:MAG: alpha/beta hydrolase [Candidatus Izimaplasma sp.]|nr:alpha/beta hydrolase [Candidatus Izimaplasma bacterium]
METWMYWAIGIVLLISLYFIIAYFYYRKLFVNFRHHSIQLFDPEAELNKETYNWYKEIPKEDIYIKSYDNLKLHGIYIPSHDKKSEKLAFVLHGYKSSSYDLIPICKMYSDLGFKVLLVDFRGHGKSEGKFTSMGHYEKYDMKNWLHYATRNYGQKIEILLHGVSMGAATSVLATQFKESKNVNLLVLESGFTSLKATLKLSTRFKPLLIFLFGINFYTFIFHKFFLSEINPLKVIEKSTIPILIIHSEKDRAISEAMSKELFEAINTDTKDYLSIKDSKHAMAFSFDQNNYVKKVLKMTNKVFSLKKSDVKKYK